MTCGQKSNEYSPVRKSRKKCKKSQFRSRKSGYCRKRKCGSGRTRDLVTGLCRNKKSRRKSPKRKSRSIKSTSRKSSTRKSRSRKSPCPTGMILNKSNGRCRVKCVPGKTTRSRSTGRCRKIKSSTRKSSSRKSRSRKSSTRKSRSRKSSSMKKLPKCTKEGQTRSRSTRRCRVPPCPPGKIRNKSTGGKCRVKCQPGRIRGPTGRCIKRPKKVQNDETGSIISDNRELDYSDELINWDKNDFMFPNSRGFTPPPGRNYLDKPAWSSISSKRSTEPTWSTMTSETRSVRPKWSPISPPEGKRPFVRVTKPLARASHPSDLRMFNPHDYDDDKSGGISFAS